VTVHGEAVDTRLPRLEAVPNFRDIGGHRTSDGRRVRTGRLFRSVALDSATDDDLIALAGLGVRTVFDLRTSAELERRPDRLPQGATHVHLDLLTDSGEADPTAYFELMQDPPRASVELAGGATERFYLATYRDMVRLPSARAGYARLFRMLAEEPAQAGLVHCTTGKDRTGWAVAALLRFLGVDARAVAADYLVSDAEIRRAYRWLVDDFVARGGAPEIIEPMMRVKRGYLEVAVETMLADYGSVEGYFDQGLGLDHDVQDALRGAFLD
jgi:protein-tyrosine phosphatase